MMTDSSGAVVWRATYMPFGEVYLITGSESYDYRFPGQGPQGAEEWGEETRCRPERGKAQIP